MPFPFLGAASLGIGALSGLFGKPKQPKPQDLNIYGYNQNQRNDIAGSNFGMLQRMTNADPSRYGGANATNHPYWGGQSSWTTSRDLVPQGMDLGSAIFGLGGGGGGGYASAGHASAGHATAQQATANLSPLDLNADIYNLTIPEAQRQRLLTKSNEYLGAQTADQIRQFNEQATAGGSMNSPAAIAARAAFGRQKLRSQADTMRDIESNWFDKAGTWQAGARSQQAQILNDIESLNAQLGTQTSIANAGFDTNTSIANAGYDTQASGINAQLSDNAAERMQRGGMFAAGLRGQDEDRMMQRYGMLNDMNFNSLRPIGSMTQGPPQQSTFGSILGGMGAGMNLFSGLGGSQGIRGLFGLGGGATPPINPNGGFGTGYANQFASQFGMPGSFGGGGFGRNYQSPFNFGM